MNEIFRFHSPFKQVACPKCGFPLDPEMSKCPHCGTIVDEKKEFAAIPPDGFHVSPARQIALFLSVYAGLQVVSLIVGLAVYGLSLNEVTQNVIINYLTYAILLGVVLAIMWPELKDIFRSFLSPKIFYGFLGVAAILLLNMLYQLCIQGLGVEPSINQSSLTVMVKAYPAISIIFLGFIGPFVEECGYRIGLFGFFRRINIILAYLIVSAVFGLIHIHDWTSVNEWLNYPTYVISGLVLGFLYDRVGFSASYLCHITNNLVSVISIIVSSGAA